MLSHLVHIDLMTCFDIIVIISFGDNDTTLLNSNRSE